ncbi:MAG: hypothetical protein ACAI35_06055 [Candidatus Methylacidiphilales bacterium]
MPDYPTNGQLSDGTWLFGPLLKPPESISYTEVIIDGAPVYIGYVGHLNKEKFKPEIEFFARYKMLRNDVDSAKAKESLASEEVIELLSRTIHVIEAMHTAQNARLANIEERLAVSPAVPLV